MDDAAKSVEWVYNNIEKYGGSKKLKNFLSGYSAGGYISSMLGLDKKYLKKYEIDSDILAGIISLSGHTITHMTVREEMGISSKQPYVDRMSQVFHTLEKTHHHIL